MLTKNKWIRWGCIALFLAAIVVSTRFCTGESFITTSLEDEVNYRPLPELTSETVYSQTLPCVFDRVQRIGVQFANFSNRSNIGTVDIEVTASGEPVGAQQIDAAAVSDFGYQYVELERDVRLNEPLEIRISSDSAEGQSVTALLTDSPFLTKNGAAFALNGTQLQGQLSMEFGYRSPKLSHTFWVLLLLWCLLLLATGVPQYYYRRYMTVPRQQRLGLYLFLFLLGTCIVTLRDLQFITTPIIYGEDGSFLSRQLNEGILKTAFATRSGKADDFSNTGVYSIIWLAQKTNMLLNGYTLAAYPFWAGLYTNMYIAFTAVLGFRAFELTCGRKMGLVAYAAVVLADIGNSAAEVLGRPLNSAFLWTVTVAFLLMIQYVLDDGFTLRSVFIGGVCLVGAFTLPVAFGEIAVFLAAMAWRCLKDKQWRKRIFGNCIQIAALLAGVIMLPRLLTSEGAGIWFTYNPDGAVDYYLARHILYFFVRPFYADLNDMSTICLFAVYMGAVAVAAVDQIKKTKSLFNHFTTFAVMTLCVCFASAYMRRTMTERFGNYNNTYPDRYYFACNILAFMLLLYAGCTLARRFRKEKITTCLCTVSMCLLLTNPYLFNFSEPNYGALYGGDFTYTFAQSCHNALQDAEAIDGEEKSIAVDIYPAGWSEEFPARYVIATAADAQRD